MKLWIDDVRPAPEGYKWCKSVNRERKRNGGKPKHYFGKVKKLNEIAKSISNC